VIRCWIIDYMMACRHFHITTGASTLPRCELSNDAPDAAMNNLFFCGGRRKPSAEGGVSNGVERSAEGGERRACACYAHVHGKEIHTSGC